MKKPELLIPASSLEVLKTAVIYGADAVYIGGRSVQPPGKIQNFTLEDMKEGVALPTSIMSVFMSRRIYLPIIHLWKCRNIFRR